MINPYNGTIPQIISSYRLYYVRPHHDEAHAHLNVVEPTALARGIHTATVKLSSPVVNSMVTKIKCSHILVKKQGEALRILERLKNREKFGDLS